MVKNSLLTDEEIKQLIDISEKCIRVRKVLKLGNTTLTPLNYNQEKERFFASRKYNPVFEYKHLDLSKISSVILHLEKQLRNLALPDDLKDHLESYIDNLMLLYKTKSSVGTYNFPENFENLLEWNQYKNLKTPSLEEVHTRQTENPGKLYSASDIKDEFLKVLEKRYKIKSFDVIVSPITTNIISTGYNHLTIGSKVKRHRDNVKRLVVHEIESHALQTYNMRQMPLYSELAYYSDALIYAEGLAVYNEVKTKKITDSALNTYKLRFESAKMLGKSFREIFDYLSEHMNPEKAYTTAYRMKRGTKNTALAGGNPKDAVYLLGYNLIHKRISKGILNKNKLYRTKSPKLTDLLEKYNLLDDQKVVLPTFYKS